MEDLVDMGVARLLVCGILIALGSLSSSQGSPSPAAPVAWLIFVDDLHISFRDTGYVRNLLRSIATELFQDGDSFVIRSSGPSAVSVPLNTDRAVLDAAISKVAGNELVPGDCVGIETIDDEMRYRAELAGRAATEMLSSLPMKTTGRAALLYISDGYPRLPADTRIAEVPRIAQQSAVTVFALNPRGLRTVAPSAGPILRSCVRDDVMMKSLRAIAEPTGGSAILDAADFANALHRIGRAMR